MAYSSNIDKILRNLKRREANTMKAAEHGIKMGLRRYEARIITHELSGRKGNKGLNRQSGDLSNSWSVDTKRQGKNVIGTLATRAIYARIHQFGGIIVPRRAKKLVFKIGKKTIAADSVTMPKRLYILENFKKIGKNMIIKELSKSLKAAIR